MLSDANEMCVAPHDVWSSVFEVSCVDGLNVKGWPRVRVDTLAGKGFLGVEPVDDHIGSPEPRDVLLLYSGLIVGLGRGRPARPG